MAEQLQYSLIKGNMRSVQLIESLAMILVYLAFND